ncbi:diaminopimelate epimerase [Vallicoccus soli]|uniref:Diaminopimelate epimerase n=1 Tax=Vallicoccus soli TaxID=2339232 RepID=A0A3A3ZKL5_9ACTN|nr:diaminopimelate epimerase [Vallicoccus soli]RJK96464.1 diaminopimelate epimerase [Vallicoccus soli]
MRGIPFAKGHGTENDFVVVPDPDGELDLGARLVTALCDRRAGVGGDGVLRVVRTVHVPEVADQAGAAEWCMDYRNADGSVAQMCGNGVRVFARYLVDAGLAGPGDLAVATRGGTKRVRFEDDGTVTVDMGAAELPERLARVEVSAAGRRWPALGVLMPNPHAVAQVEDLAHAGALREAPVVGPEGSYPEGVNVEFVVDRGPAHVALRVHERGVGETRSCGTGAAAVLVAARRRAGLGPQDDERRSWRIDVPGGRLQGTERADGHVDLRGPAVLVARGELDPEWVAAHR